MLERINQRYLIKDVFQFIKDNSLSADKKKKVMFDGHLVKPFSQRYKLFMTKGTTCYACGLEATHFYKEKHGDATSYHFNLYGIKKNGDEVLFTKDHIIPRSKGGRNFVSNYDTMCTECNCEKDTMSLDEWEEYRKNKDD